MVVLQWSTQSTWWKIQNGYLSLCSVLEVTSFVHRYLFGAFFLRRNNDPLQTVMKGKLYQEIKDERYHTIPSKLPTIMEPIGSYIGFPVVLTATNDPAAIARPVTAAPSCRTSPSFRSTKQIWKQEDNSHRFIKNQSFPVPVSSTRGRQSILKRHEYLFSSKEGNLRHDSNRCWIVTTPNIVPHFHSFCSCTFLDGIYSNNQRRTWKYTLGQLEWSNEEGNWLSRDGVTPSIRNEPPITKAAYCIFSGGCSANNFFKYLTQKKRDELAGRSL